MNKILYERQVFTVPLEAQQGNLTELRLSERMWQNESTHVFFKLVRELQGEGPSRVPPVSSAKWSSTPRPVEGKCALITADRHQAPLVQTQINNKLQIAAFSAHLDTERTKSSLM